MRQLLRMAFTFAAIVMIAVVGIVYAKVGTLLVDMGTGDGQFSGFLSDRISQIDTLIPILLSALLLGAVIYFIVGGVRDERSVSRRPRR